MDNSGYFLLHRKIREHWIWEDPKKFQWWIDIILLTNHTEKKTMIGGKLTVIKRGTFHTSEIKLSDRWNVSRNTVRRFLELLEADEMITTIKTKNGTTIKVHNYSIYQDFSLGKKQPIEQQSEQSNEHLTAQKKNNKVNTTKEFKELNTLKEKEGEEISISDLEKIADYYQSVITQLMPNDYNELKQDCKQYGKALVCKAIEEAGRRGAREFNRPYTYITKCLIDWDKRGLKTKEAVDHYLNGRNKNSKVKPFQSPYKNSEDIKELTPQEIYDAWK